MTTSQRLFPIILSCFAAATSLFARSAGAPQGHSGAPGDNVCTACHRSNPDVNSGPGRVTVTFSDGSTYTPGVAKKVTVTITDPNGQRWGFQASPRLASSPNNTGAGQVTPSDDNTQVIGTDGTRQWITHTSARDEERYCGSGIVRIQLGSSVQQRWRRRFLCCCERGKRKRK